MKALQILADILINTGIGMGFFMAFFFYSSKEKVRSHVLLALLLINLSLIIFSTYYLNPFFDVASGRPFLISGPFVFLLGPLMFFYLRNMVIPFSTITRKEFLHFIPFLVFFALSVPVYLQGKDTPFFQFLQRLIGSPWIFLVLQYGYYLFKVRNLSRLHKENIEKKFSNVEGMDVSWINLVLWIFILTFIFILIVIPGTYHTIGYSNFSTINSLFFSFALFFMAYKGFMQKADKTPEMLPNDDESEMKMATNEMLQELKDHLVDCMEKKRPYLNPELTLTDLAKQVDISRNQLSQVINTAAGNNFYDFVNKYRVDEVKRLIMDESKKHYKIMALASDAGFNSKSAFNNIFKKITGLTPSEYRERQP